MEVSSSLHFRTVVGMYEYIQQHHADFRRMANAALAARLKPSCTHSNKLPVS